MTLLSFANRLTESGRIRVPEFLPQEEELTDSEEGLPQLREAIAEADLRRRSNLGFSTPALDRGAAYWSLTRLYRACRFVVSRSVEPETIRAALHSQIEGVTAAQHYSVDLGLEYWAEMVQLAQARSRHDPLIEIAREFVAPWPISSVGLVPAVKPDPSQLQVVLSHPATRQLYTDRVIERRDFEHAQHPAVAELLAPLLCPGDLDQLRSPRDPFAG